MAQTVNNLRRNALIALCAGFIAGAGTIDGFAHASKPYEGAIVRSIDGVTFTPQLAAESDRAFELFRRMITADAQTTVEGDQTTTLYRDYRTVVSYQHVIRDGSRGLRMVYTAPPRMRDTVVVDDGNTLWRFDPKLNTLNVSPSKIKKRMQRLPEILNLRQKQKLGVTIIGTGQVAGRPCTVIQVERNRDPGPLRTFWVDDATGVQLKIELRERSGQLRSVTEFTSVTFNSPVPAGAFARPATPATARVQQRTATAATSMQAVTTQAGFPLLQPGYLPPGYRFTSAQVTTFEGRQMVHARYLGGLDPLSIFQTPASGPASRVTYPSHGVATMIIENHRVVVVGNLSNEELSRVITSMHP